MKERETTFEAALSRLEAVVKQLESGSGSLEEMISLYDEGMRLHEQCAKLLDAYEAKLTKLTAQTRTEDD